MIFRTSPSLLLFLSFTVCAICVAIPLQPSPALQLGAHPKRNDDCGFQGNSDLYGLGIRLGVYFQWASAQIVYGWYPEGRKDLAESYLVFLFVITITIIVITVRAEPTYAAEILILTYIIFGGIFTVVSVGIRERHRSRIEKNGHHAEVLIFTMILASVSIYCAWFWIHGIHHNALETPCGTFGFLFAKVSLYNKSVYKFFAFLSLYFATAYGGTLLYIANMFVLSLFGVSKASEYMELIFFSRRGLSEIPGNGNTAPASVGEPPEQTHRVPSQSKKIYNWVFSTVSPFSLAYSVTGIETTIYWNKISDVYTINTTGQLIPFVIGLAGLAKVIYEPIKIWFYRHHAMSIGVVSVADGGQKHTQKEFKQVGREVIEANHRLGYLDLSKPVEESTVHNMSNSGASMRPMSGISRPSS